MSAARYARSCEAICPTRPGVLYTSTEVCRSRVCERNKRGAGIREPGSEQLETGNWELGTGNWELGTGNWKLETGNWKLETVVSKPKPTRFSIMIESCSLVDSA